MKHAWEIRRHCQPRAMTRRGQVKLPVSSYPIFPKHKVSLPYTLDMEATVKGKREFVVSITSTLAHLSQPMVGTLFIISQLVDTPKCNIWKNEHDGRLSHMSNAASSRSCATRLLKNEYHASTLSSSAACRVDARDELLFVRDSRLTAPTTPRVPDLRAFE